MGLLTVVTSNYFIVSSGVFLLQFRAILRTRLFLCFVAACPCLHSLVGASIHRQDVDFFPRFLVVVVDRSLRAPALLSGGASFSGGRGKRRSLFTLPSPAGRVNPFPVPSFNVSTQAPPNAPSDERAVPSGAEVDEGRRRNLEEITTEELFREQEEVVCSPPLLAIEDSPADPPLDSALPSALGPIPLLCQEHNNNNNDNNETNEQTARFSSEPSSAATVVMEEVSGRVSEASEPPLTVLSRPHRQTDRRFSRSRSPTREERLQQLSRTLPSFVAALRGSVDNNNNTTLPPSSSSSSSSPSSSSSSSATGLPINRQDTQPVLIVSDEDDSRVSTSSRGRRRRATTRLETSTDVNLSRRLLGFHDSIETTSSVRRVIRETRTVVEEEYTYEEDAEGRPVIPHTLRRGKEKAYIKREKKGKRERKKNKNPNNKHHCCFFFFFFFFFYRTKTGGKRCIRPSVYDVPRPPHHGRRHAANSATRRTRKPPSTD